MCITFRTHTRRRFDAERLRERQEQQTELEFIEAKIKGVLRRKMSARDARIAQLQQLQNAAADRETEMHQRRQDQLSLSSPVTPRVRTPR